MHGLFFGSSAHCCEKSSPFLSIKIASPGSTSLNFLKPCDENNASSDEITYSSLVLPFLIPIDKGLIPLLSLKATKPCPAINARTAYAPVSYTHLTLPTILLV